MTTTRSEQREQLRQLLKQQLLNAVNLVEQLRLFDPENE
jgi:hypothetical protein